MAPTQTVHIRSQHVRITPSTIAGNLKDLFDAPDETLLYGQGDQFVTFGDDHTLRTTLPDSASLLFDTDDEAHTPLDEPVAVTGDSTDELIHDQTTATDDPTSSAPPLTDSGFLGCRSGLGGLRSAASYCPAAVCPSYGFLRAAPTQVVFQRIHQSDC